MPIRVLLVEDSPVAQVILKRILEASPQIEVVGTASTGLEALAMIPNVAPQVICTDLHMPKMDGLSLTIEVMAHYPCPILVVSSSVQEDDPQNVFHLLAAGAVDIFPKPCGGLSPVDPVLNQALIDKILVLAGVKVFKKKRAHSILGKRHRLPLMHARYHSRPRIIAIGASTGGPQALQKLFAKLPTDFPPILCVQHISAGFLQGLIDWLKKTCALSIEIAQPGQKPQSGHIYFPAENHHLALDTKGQFVHLDLPSVDGHRPSITVTFDAVAHRYGRHAMGILLTGMGQDGAIGLKAICQSGGMTIAQDDSTSVVFGMPKVAIELGAAQQVLPIDAIAQTLLNSVSQPHLRPS
ncbi:MAG: chemotaxis-specific protein-glutamate methyltransferase CheB [Cyanobacteria bacterium P01_D01_bin.44]